MKKKSEALLLCLCVWRLEAGAFCSFINGMKSWAQTVWRSMKGFTFTAAVQTLKVCRARLRAHSDQVWKRCQHAINLVKSQGKRGLSYRRMQRQRTHSRTITLIMGTLQNSSLLGSVIYVWKNVSGCTEKHRRTQRSQPLGRGSLAHSENTLNNVITVIQRLVQEHFEKKMLQLGCSLSESIRDRTQPPKTDGIQDAFYVCSLEMMTGETACTERLTHAECQSKKKASNRFVVVIAVKVWSHRII